MKCIVFISHLQNKKLFDLVQDGSREFNFLLVCICVDGIVLLLVLIYENVSNDLQNIWLEDFDVIKNQIYFVVFLKVGLIRNWDYFGLWNYLNLK